MNSKTIMSAVKSLIAVLICVSHFKISASGQIYNTGTFKIINGGFVLSTGDVTNASGTIANDGQLEIRGNFVNKAVYNSAGDDSLLLTGSASSDLNSGSAIYYYLQAKKSNNSTVILSGTARVLRKFELIEGGFSTDPINNYELIAPVSAIFRFGTGTEITGKVRRTNWLNDTTVIFHNPNMAIKTYEGIAPKSMLINMIPGGDPTLSEKEIKRYFFFSPEGGTNYMADVTFPYKNSELNVNNENSIVPWYYSKIKNKWISRVTATNLNINNRNIFAKGIRANIFADTEWKLAEVEYNSRKENLFVYPIPAKTTISIVLISQQNDQASFKLFDAAGKLCRVVQTKVVRGINNLTLNVTGLSPGQYTLNVEEVNNRQTKAIIIF